jgi:Muramidase (flagellum-specific)
MNSKKSNYTLAAIFVISIVIGGMFSVAYLLNNRLTSDSLRERISHLEGIILDVESVRLAEFKDSVYQYILDINLAHPDLVFRQACIESGNFGSRLFREHNNMFGMKIATKRPTLGKIKSESSMREYSYYENWRESIVDYALYQAWSARGLNEEDYIAHLGRSYAEDSLYTKKLSRGK